MINPDFFNGMVTKDSHAAPSGCEWYQLGDAKGTLRSSEDSPWLGTICCKTKLLYGHGSWHLWCHMTGWWFTSINPIYFDVHERCQGFDPLPYCSIASQMAGSPWRTGAIYSATDLQKLRNLRSSLLCHRMWLQQSVQWEESWVGLRDKISEEKTIGMGHE